MPYFRFENGMREGNRIPIGSGGSLLVGRAAACDLRVTDPDVAERHAQIKEHKGRYFVRDLGSDSGTFVNDQPVKTAEIQINDLLRVGSTQLSFLEVSSALHQDSTKSRGPQQSTQDPLPQNAAQKTTPLSGTASTSTGKNPDRAQTLVGKTLAGYRIEERVGNGGMGTVYRATQLSLDREVALKVLSPKLTKDTHFVEQFVREARAAGQLNHAHIVQVYDVAKEGALYFYAMEYVSGGSVADRLKRETSFEHSKALRICLEAARALAYAEIKQIVHRDIKPDNLMMTELDQVKIADLGLARSLQESAEKEPQGILGTPHFISPEQVLRKPVDIRSDIYSLGATFYMMVSGTTPFEGSDAREILRKQVKEEPRPIRDAAPEIPEKIALIIEKMMKKDPGERPQSAEALVEELEGLAEKRRKTALIVVPFLLLGIGGGLWGIFGSSPEQVIERTGIEKSDLDRAVQEARSKERNQREQIEFELEATRAWAALPEAESRDARLFDLDTFIEKFEGTDAIIPAMEERTSIRSAIESDRLREEALVGKIEERSSALRTSVGTQLHAGGYQTALTLLGAGEEDPELGNNESILALKEELIKQVKSQVSDRSQSMIQEIDGSIEQKKYSEAKARLAEAKSFIAIDWSVVQGQDGSFQASLLESVQSLESKLAESQRLDALAGRAQDLSALAHLMDLDQMPGAICRLDFEAATALIDQCKDQLLSPSALEVIAPWGKWMKDASSLRKRLEDDIRSAALTETRFTHPGDGKRMHLIGLSIDGSTLLAAADAGSNDPDFSVGFDAFGNSSDFCGLFSQRVAWSDEEKTILARTSMLVTLASFVRSLAPLRLALDSYVPDKGWNVPPSLKDATFEAPNWAHVQRLITDAESGGWPNDLSQAFEGVLAQEVEACHLLARGIAPFLDKEAGGPTFVDAAGALSELANQYRHTALVSLAYSLLDGGDESLNLID